MNTAALAAAVAVAGGLGAVGRYVLDATIQRRLRSTVPVGTLVVNLAGSFLLGLATGVVVHHGVSPEVKAVLGVGFCGGLTTFSTASFETVRLLRAELVRDAALVALGGLVLSALAGAVGLALALV